MAAKKRGAKTKRVTLMGKRWTLKLVPKNNRRDHFGSCDHPEDVGKSIVVEANHDDLRVLNTVLHECMHGGAWNLDESVVKQWADDVAKIVIDLGYRREQPQP